jgi:catechol 2,3-dioxygenase-like lactoylglutathione lyase family enzyme
MDQRITAVTLGVADLPRSEAFYRALGWERVNDDAEVAFFQAGGMVLALWVAPRWRRTAGSRTPEVGAA